MANNIDTVEKAQAAGAYDAQNGQGAYKNALTAPTLSTAPISTASSVQPVNTARISTKDLGKVSIGTQPTLNVKPTTDNLGIATNTAVSQIQTDSTATPQVNPDRAVLNSGLKNLIANIGGQADATNKIAKEEKLFEKKQKATAISTELDVLDKQYRDKVNALKKNLEGTFGGAVEQDIAQATDEYNNNRANVALVYKVAVEDYNGAAEIVNSKVSALKDQNAQALQAYNAYAQFLNNDLSDSEKLQVQSQLAIKQQQAKTTEDAYATYLSLAVQNKAPASVLAAIDQAARQPGATAATIAAATGQYGIDPLQALKIQAAKADIANTYSTINARNVAQSQSQSETSSSNSPLALAQDKGNIDLLSSIAVDKGLSGAVGTNFLARTSLTNFVTGAKTNFIASVEQLRSQLTLDSLINAKAKGATFGALSEGELKTLSSSASKLGTWAIKDKNGNVTGYNASEADFKKEIDKINNFAKLDYLIKGGNPSDVGVTVLPDGSIVTKNSDGSITRLN